MDFRSLILIAQRNSQAALQTSSASSGGKRKADDRVGVGYPTKFEPPKKQAKQEKKISANVQRFLESQEQKSQSARKSGTSNGSQQAAVTADAIDSFESSEANQIYERLLNKFESVATPETTGKTHKAGGSNIGKVSGKKDTLKPSAREVATKPSTSVEKSKTQPDVVKATTKPSKPIKAAPPVLDFKALLELAEQNKAGKGTSGPPSTTKGGPTRLLTEKEKRKLAEEKEKRKPNQQPHSNPDRVKNSKLPHSQTKSNIPKEPAKPTNHSTSAGLVPSSSSSTANKPSRPIPPPNYFTKMNSAKPHPPPKQRSNRRVIDDDSSEYDSDMDDFIDDDTATEDYSAHIKEIFGYDKSRYRHMDEDDAADNMMVSSFAQQMREEQISRKIGLMEDLEDMRAEEAAEAEKRRRRKMMQKS